MAGEVLADLTAALEAAVRGMLNAVRAFVGTLRSRATGWPAARFFGRDGHGESKSSLPVPRNALQADEGALPDSRGKTRLVLLVVDPNHVHAYWEVAPEKLRQVWNRAGASARAVLRFYEGAGSFDVNVDLRPGNWYVPLRSGGASCYADLGLTDAEGNVFQLARSNAVVTPRALPVAADGERAMRAAANGGGAGAAIIIPPPDHEPERPGMPPPRPPAVAAVPPNPGLPPAELPQPIDSAEIMRRKLAEIYASREWRSEPVKPVEAARDPAGPAAEERYSDLTDMAEKRQIRGLSSASPRERHPEP